MCNKLHALGWLLALAMGSAVLPASARAQDPSSSADHPPGNVNELTLAGLRPGASRISAAIARFGRHWRHPTPDEADLYIWCDARNRLQLSLEAKPDGTIQVVTVDRLWDAPAAGACGATLPEEVGRTGRGVRLGDTVARLDGVYGHPFFDGPSSWDGHDVHFVVFNFSWAGTDKPQILESSFDDAGKLVKLTLSAEYY
ncbi:MAG TPA: hypothetical protein VN515_00705 [Terriglobales bacterium]|nr:hypothetical protein [Terriglobales bacterium]